MSTKERLHRLVEGLSDDEVRTAERFLENLANLDDPVLRALLDAPESALPETAADAEAVREGRAAYGQGDVVADEELEDELDS